MTSIDPYYAEMAKRSIECGHKPLFDLDYYDQHKRVSVIGPLPLWLITAAVLEARQQPGIVSACARSYPSTNREGLSYEVARLECKA